MRFEFEGPGLYILDGHRAVREPDLLAWAKWYEQADRDGSRVVGSFEERGVRVSTVFLGMDHGFGRGRGPMLFETMIFGGELDHAQWRFATWEEAEAHHMATCRTLRAAQQDSAVTNEKDDR